MPRTIQLNAKEIEQGLPAVCIRCGAPASVWVDKAFTTTDPRVSASASAALVQYVEHSTKPKVRVKIPFCGAHARHWTMRLLFGILMVWLGAPTLLAVGAVIGSRVSSGSMGGIGIGTGLGLLAWFLLFHFGLKRWVHAGLVTYDQVTLHRVADEFARAVSNRRDTAAGAEPE